MEDVIQTAGVLLIRNMEEVLLVRHGKSASHLTDTYGLPAGRLGEDESEIEAAIREFREETGLTTSEESLIELPKLYTATIQRKDGSKTFSVRVFLCKSFSGELRTTEESEPVWIGIRDVNKYNLLPNVKQIISDGSSLA